MSKIELTEGVVEKTHCAKRWRLKSPPRRCLARFIRIALSSCVICVAVGGILLSGWMLPRASAESAHRVRAEDCDTAAPDDVFKDKGLTRSGFLLVLHQEADVHAAALAVKSMRVKVSTESSGRASLTRSIEIADTVLTKLNSDLSDKKEQMKSLKDNIDAYNNVVDQYNDELAVLKKRAAAYDELKKKLDKLPNSQPVCNEGEIAAAEKADALMTAYAVLAVDPVLTAAIARYNKTAPQAAKLGPTGGCAADIAYIKKCIGEMEADGVPVRMVGQVPLVEVIINGKKKTMLWDSGAASVFLSAETAEELDLHVTDQDPLFHAVAADGHVIECREIIVPVIRVGPFTAHNVEVTVAPKGDKRGDDLLGGAFQKHFLCRLDQEASVLHLTPNAAVAEGPAKPAQAVVAASKGDIFQAKGLTVAGKLLVSAQEADIHKSVMALRGLKTKVASEANARTAMYRAVGNAANIYGEIRDDLEKIDEQIKAAKGKDDVAYNRLIDSYNTELKQARERWAKLNELHKKLGTMQDSQSAYTQSALASARKAGATVVAYAQMGNDAALKAAVEKYNKSAKEAVVLGPSADFSKDLDFLKQTLTDIANDGIPITIEGGVPNVVVTVNGKDLEMVWDSGASYVSFSSETAAELGLKATDKDKTVTINLAGGKQIESKLIVVPSITVGGYTAYNVECIINPPSANRGADLLGGTFQSQFLCKLDRQAGVLHLTPNDQSAAQPAAGSTPGRP